MPADGTGEGLECFFSQGQKGERALINFSAVRPGTIAGKIARLPFRALPRDMVLPVLQGPLRGKKWIVGSHLHGCWLGSYEWTMQRRMAKELKPGSVFYDVGANVGLYTLLAATLVAPGRVYAMEPLPANVGYLRKHLALNGMRNVDVLEIAVSDQVGTAQFEAEETRAMGRIGTRGNVVVQTSTLDALLQEGRIAPPDLIKMDIEGAEFLALRGARECFARYQPKLFLATHGRDVHDNCCELLKSWGYQHQYMSRESEDRAELLAFQRAD
jgi:FkbM family methyltransferase